MSQRHPDLLLLSPRDEVRRAVQEALIGETFNLVASATASDGLQRVGRRRCHMAVVDLSGPDGAEDLRQVRAALPLTSTLVVLGTPDGEAASTVLRDGAYHVFSDPLDPIQLRQVLRNAAEKSALVEENISLRNELRRSKSLIMKDDLTSAYNRRYFDTFLEEEIERSKRFSSPLSLIFMDLDDLKQVNSRYGHAMGSLALKEAAVRIIDTVRSIDKVIRYGGDEFCIILPETDWRGAQEVAERIRANFAGDPFLVGKTQGVTLTASFGIASFPEHAGNKNDMIRKADEAMFRIKSQQKNGILVTSS